MKTYFNNSTVNNFIDILLTIENSIRFSSDIYFVLETIHRVFNFFNIKYDTG